MVQPRSSRQFALAAACSITLAACTSGKGERPGDTPPAASSDGAATTGPPGARNVPGEPGPPWFTLPAGSRYFERAGVRAPVLMRNVSVPTVGGFTPLFADARAAGTTVVRLQLTQGFGYDTLGIDASGGVLSGWIASWGAVFDEAERQGLAVIPVFAISGDWNSGEPALGWSHFDANPLRQGRGGPARSPQELFADTETQRAWLSWLGTIVERNADRPNIIAWEIFSELDLATGATEQSATEFVERARTLIREKDQWSRPAFASTSDLPLINGQPWRALWDSPSNDIVVIHPYDPELDRVAVDRVRIVLGMTNKPVLIGESGLSAEAPTGTTLTSAANAGAGLQNAIWAELVSGAASARALYWEDGYAVYYPGTGLPLVNRHKDLESSAARWLANADFRELAPLDLAVGDYTSFGVALGGATRVLGWVRNAALAPPDWQAPALGTTSILITLAPATPDATWEVSLTDATSGDASAIEGSSRGGLLSFDIPGPFQSVAFNATLRPGTLPSGNAPAGCPDIGAGQCTSAYQLVMNGSSVFPDPACPAQAVHVNGFACRGGVSFSLNSCTSDELSERRSCVSLYFGGLGTEASGMGDYFDAAGTRYTLEVDTLDFDVAAAPAGTLRSGVVGGTLAGGDAGVSRFSLSFSACYHGIAYCLI